MTRKTLISLILCLLGLGALFYILRPSALLNGDAEKQALFPEGNERLTKIRITEANDSVELEQRDQNWTVPARANYPADFVKVYSLIVKLFGLNVSQKITSNEANFERLGVSQEAVKNGKKLLSFFDKDGKEFAGIFLGDLRKTKDEAGSPGMKGQYVRRSDQNDVYLIPEPISVSSSISGWLDPIIANVISSDLRSITQYQLVEGAQSEDFALARSEEAKNDGGSTEGELALIGAPPSGEKLKDVVISQIRSGLENLRLSDVMKADDERIGGLQFDRRTVFRLKNGLVYQLDSAVKDEKFWAKLSVSRDEELVKELEEEIERIKKLKEERTKAEQEKQAKGGDKAQETKADESSNIPEPPIVANLDEVKKVNERLQGWVFELAKFAAQKFRYSRPELFEKQEDKTKSNDSADAAAASPASSNKKAEKKAKGV